LVRCCCQARGLTRLQTLAPFLNDQAIGSLNRLVDDSSDTYRVGMSSIEEAPTAPKAEHSDEESFSESSPEIDEQNFVQEVTQVQKRKGGRKPVRGDGGRVGMFSRAKLIPDLCNLGGTQAKEPSSSSCLSRTSNRVHQAAGNYHQASRRHAAESTAKPSLGGG